MPLVNIFGNLGELITKPSYCEPSVFTNFLIDCFNQTVVDNRMPTSPCFVVNIGAPIIELSNPHSQHFISHYIFTINLYKMAVGSLVVRASGSRPEGLGSMPDATK
ncbi:hypothetical protein TNCV_1071881 [Trichonephila clavipes]|nr:hypothetical protein TNCV_1071881 [Trichonephila clavipes]